MNPENKVPSKNVDECKPSFTEALGNELIKKWFDMEGSFDMESKQEISNRALDWLAPKFLHEVPKQYHDLARVAQFIKIGSEYASEINAAGRKDRKIDIPRRYDAEKKDFFFDKSLLNEFGNELLSTLEGKCVVDVAGGLNSRFMDWPRGAHAKEYINIDISHSNQLIDIDMSNFAPYFTIKGDMLLTIASMIDGSVDVFFLSGIETGVGKRFDEYMDALANEISRVLSRDGIIITGYNPELNVVIKRAFNKIKEERDEYMYCGISIYKKSS